MSTELNNYFSNVKIKTKTPNQKMVNNEYDFKPFHFHHQKDIKSYTSKTPKRNKNRSQKSKKSQLKRDKRKLKNKKSVTNKFENSISNSKQLSTNSGISIALGSQIKEKNRFQPMHYSEKKPEIKNKFKITSLSQLLKRRVPAKVKDKNRKNKNPKKNHSKKKKNFRITSKLNKTANPKYKPFGEDSSEYFKVSTIKPFEPFTTAQTNAKAQVTSNRMKKKRSNQRKINLFEKPRFEKMEKKRLESYGFIDYKANQKHPTNPRRNKKLNQVSISSNEKHKPFRNNVTSPEPQFKFISHNLSNKYKENLNSLKHKESSKKKKLIRHINKINLKDSHSSKKKFPNISKSPITSFKIL
jgi:hypothetical protein